MYREHDGTQRPHVEVVLLGAHAWRDKSGARFALGHRQVISKVPECAAMSNICGTAGGPVNVECAPDDAFGSC